MDSFLSSFSRPEFLPSLATGILLGLAFAAGPPAHAQEDPKLGAQLLWGTDGELGIGIRGDTDIEALPAPLRAVGSLDFFRPEGIHANIYDLNVGASLPVRLPEVELYVGGGLNLQRINTTAFADRDGGTHVGLSVWGGTVLGESDFAPFFELRSELGTNTQLVVSGGVLFSVR